jgi:restriction system protein
MSVWVVRAGKTGENEQTALENGLVTIGWNELPDLSGIHDRQGMADVYRQSNPEASTAKVSNALGQLWSFCSRIQNDDLVVLPLKTQAAVAVGKVTGPYQYRTDLGEGVRHIHPVKWLRKDVPRTAFGQDLLYSFGALMTVCQISRNDAEKRIRKILGGKVDTGGSGEDGREPNDDGNQVLDIEQVARDQMLEYIQRKFAGHKLATLVEAVLRAEGYLTRVSPPGPDGGVDILAGTGSLGFGSPRLCVQVKSSTAPVGVDVLRALQGILQNFHAEQGLLISWGGFKSAVINEARQSFFAIRLWDSGDLLAAILKNNEKFSDDLQAELPLKRIWALVLED